jgi:hypothetical protein
MAFSPHLSLTCGCGTQFHGKDFASTLLVHEAHSADLNGKDWRSKECDATEVQKMLGRRGMVSQSAAHKKPHRSKFGEVPRLPVDSGLSIGQGLADLHNVAFSRALQLVLRLYSKPLAGKTPLTGTALKP